MDEELIKIIDGKSLNEVTAITKMLMQHVLSEAIAKSTLALLYPEAEEIIKAISPDKFRNSIMDAITAQIASQYGA